MSDEYGKLDISDTLVAKLTSPPGLTRSGIICLSSCFRPREKRVEELTANPDREKGFPVRNFGISGFPGCGRLLAALCAGHNPETNNNDNNDKESLFQLCS